MIDLLIRYRWILGLSFAAALLIGLPAAKRAVVPDHRLELWFVDDDPALEEYRSFQSLFGNDEIVVLGYRNEALLTRPQLSRIDSLTTRLELIDGVDHVISLTNVRDLVREGFFVRQIVPSVAYTDTTRLRKVLTRSSITAGRLINDDATMTVLWIRMAANQDADGHRSQIIEQIRRTASDVLGPSPFQLGGTGVIYDGLNEATEVDFRRFMLLTYTLVFGLIYVLFRRPIFILYALLVVVFASLGALELLGQAGKQLNMVTVMLPTVITILGIADVVHVLNWYAADLNSDRLARLRSTLKSVVRPCLYTSLTTSAGFLSFAFTEMSVLNEFGLFAAIGILIAFFATLVLGAVLLPLSRPPDEESAPVLRFSRMLARITHAVWRAPAPTWLALGVISIAAVFGLRQVKIDTYTLGYLPDTHRVVEDHNQLEVLWGHYATLDLTVVPRGGRDMLDPEVISAERTFAEHVIEHRHVSKAFGLHTVVDRYSEVMRGRGRTAQTTRDINAAIKIFEAQDGEQLRRIVSPDYATGRITLTGAMLPARALGRSLEEIRDLAEHHFADIASVELAGYPPLYVRIIGYIFDAQMMSFLLALFLIVLTMWVLLRDGKLALVSMAPNLFPILIMIGAMGYLDIELDVGTATIAAILLGIAIDDTIHLLVHFQEIARDSDTRTALVHTVSRVGRSVVSTTIILSIGFSVLVLAEVQTAVYFGLLTAIGVVGALIGDLLLLPLLLKLVMEPSGAKEHARSIRRGERRFQARFLN